MLSIGWFAMIEERSLSQRPRVLAEVGLCDRHRGQSGQSHLEERRTEAVSLSTAAAETGATAELLRYVGQFVPPFVQV